MTCSLIEYANDNMIGKTSQTSSTYFWQFLKMNYRSVSTATEDELCSTIYNQYSIDHSFHCQNMFPRFEIQLKTLKLQLQNRHNYRLPNNNALLEIDASSS